jgi:hemolysin activation/secretion protein
MVELQDAADAVAKLYSSKGLLARAYFPPQKIKADGLVILRIVEAKLGRIKIDAQDQPVRMDPELAAAYLSANNASGELVNTKNLEAALSLLGELPGLEVKTELRPSETEGEVDLHVTLSDKPLVSGTVTVGNYGNFSTGTTQGLISANLNNPLGWGDLVAFNGMQTQGLTYAKVGWYVPWGVTGLKVGVDASTMNYKTVGSSAGSKGSSNSYSANLTYPLLRSATTNFNTSASYETKSYLNSRTPDNQTTSLVVSDYGVQDLVLSFSGNHYDSIGLGGVSNFTLSTTHGRWKNNIWNDSNTPNNYGQYTGTQFNKINFLFNRNQQLLEDETILSVTFSGQLSDSNLDSIERFYLGGANGVRAYPSAQGAGDEGMMLNIQLEQQLDASFKGYVFYDHGRVRQYKKTDTYSTLVPANTTNAPNLYSLSGAGFGAKYTFDSVDFNGSIAWPIGANPLYTYSTSAQAYVQQNNDGKSRQPYVWVQATYRF